MNPPYIRALVFLTWATLSSCAPASPGQAQHSDADWQKQKITVNNMTLIKAMIFAYREDHKKDPAQITDLVPAYAKDRSMMKDGWGREFYYYSSGKYFVLASFGRGGAPRHPLCEPGCVATATPPENPYDINIVMINGEWAQTPVDVDR